ncbi:MAG: hypothetical protein IKC89_06345 [Lentisphaeria bacterium]|nr:hypothetical protein [Lentisphaeria bacterium]
MRTDHRSTGKIIAVIIIVAAMFFIAGCTELERQGYSPIPQNSPGAWEMNPYH